MPCRCVRRQDAEHDGLSPGFLEGPKHQRLVRGLAPKHRGVLLGTVRAVNAKSAAFALDLAPAAEALPLRPGDGIERSSVSQCNERSVISDS